MTMRFDVQQEKWIMVQEEYRDYQISIATNHRGKNVDIMVFDLRRSEGSQDVTQEFKCFVGGEIHGTFENIRAIMNEIDEREDSVKIKVMEPAPPNSNPMWVDHVRMSIPVGRNWEILHMGDRYHEIHVYHIPSGTRISIDLNDKVKGGEAGGDS